MKKQVLSLRVPPARGCRPYGRPERVPAHTCFMPRRRPCVKQIAVPGWALLGVKSAACALLLLLYCLGTHPLIAGALTLTAAYYVALSFLPWVSVLLLCSAG